MRLIIQLWPRSILVIVSICNSALKETLLEKLLNQENVNSLLMFRQDMVNLQERFNRKCSIYLRRKIYLAKKYEDEII